MFEKIVYFLGCVDLILILFAVFISALWWGVERAFRVRRAAISWRLIQQCMRYAKENDPELREAIRKATNN
jgi:hypothetical protein